MQSELDKLIWTGRQAGYSGDYEGAISVFSDGIARFGDHPKLLRHRGHRLITLRRFEEARADLEIAADQLPTFTDEVEPDGIPNERNQPVSSLHSNVWYHLGLANYLLGDWRGAIDAYRRGDYANVNPDRIVSTSFWVTLALRRYGEPHAPQLERVDSTADVIENDAYLQLLLVFRGERSEEDLLKTATEGTAFSTIGHGVGVWRILDGRAEDGIPLLNRVVEESPSAAFGTIAAEGELRRIESATSRKQRN